MSLLSLDHSFTESLYHLTRDSAAFQQIAYAVATYLMYLLPVMLVALFWRPASRVVSAKIFVMTIFTWEGLSRVLGSYLYSQYGFRDRPFATQGLTELLFEQPQKAFPSDHAAVLLFVTLALFYYGHKRWAWLFVAITLLSCLARVAIGFHWAGDIIGGWLVGLVGFGLLVALNPVLQRIGEKFFGLFSRGNTNEAVR